MEEALMKKSNDDRYRPYKISYPGIYDPDGLRPLKDPRLGEAQKFKEKIYRKHGFKDDDDDDDADVSNSKLPLRVINRPLYGPWPTNFSPSLVESKLTEHERAIPVVRMPHHGPPPPYSSVCTSKAESDKRFERRWKEKLRQAVEHEAEHLKETDCLCAETAIKFYNQKHGTDYKIVETLGSYVSIYTGFWYHCNFRAQSSKSHPSPPKLFFAELNKTAQHHVVKVCMPLDDGRVIRSPIVRGCEMCGNQLLHPVNGFEAGSSSSYCGGYVEEET